MADKRTRWIIEATSNIPDINTQLEKLIQLQRTQNELTQQNTTITSLAMQRQREQIESLSAAQTKANNSSAQGGKQQTDMMGALRKEYDMLSKTLSGIVNLAAGAWAVGQIKNYAMEVISAKSAQDGFVASMEKMLGSRLKAEELNAKLMEIASKSPFSITQIQDVTKQLQGMGVETNKLIPYINALGDIAAIVGTGKLPLIAKAMTDVQNKGILMGGEIRQFTENGIPLFDLLAKSMEKPREEVVKLANAHKISFAEVEKAILQSTQKGGLYYGQMSAQAEQLGGKVANLGDKFTLGLAKVGDYFEKGIKGGIEILGKLIDVTIGSSSAINRSIGYMEAAASVYALYRIAVISVNAALKANQVETLAGIAAKEADAIVTVTMTTATTGLRTTMTGLWAVMRANPIGAVITLVTALYTAYQIWDAASTDVVNSLGEEEIKLKNQQQLLNDSVKSVTSLAMGTQERKKAMEGLISKYPEYFGGLSAETTNNATLNGILSKVNLSLKERIDLSRQAYLINQYEEKRTELLKQEAELMDRIKKRSPELYAQVAGDSQKLMEAINKGGSAFIVDLDKKGGILRNAWDNMMNGTILKSAATISKGLKDVDKEILAASTRRESITKKEQEASIDAETARWKAVAAQMKKGTKDYEAAKDDHEKKVRDLTGQTVTAELNGIEKVGKAKKSSLELSLENDLKELKSLEKTYQTRMAILVTEEKLKIEQAKRQITNSADEQERILSIEKEYANKRNTLVIESAKENMAEAVKWFEKEVEAGKAKQAKFSVMRDAETKEVKAMYKDNAKLDQELVDLQVQNKEKQAEYNEMYNGEMLKSNKKFWQDSELLFLEGVSQEQQAQVQRWQAEKEMLQDRANAIEGSVLKQREYKDILVQIEILNGKIAGGQAENFKTEAEIYAKKIEQARKWMSVMYEIAGVAKSLSDSETQAYAASWDAAVVAVDKFYEYALEANEKSFEKQLENTKLSLQAITGVWNEYADRQRALLESKQGFDAAAANMKNVLDNMQAVDENMSKFTQLLSEGKWLGAVVNAVSNIFTTKKRLAEATHEMEQMQMQQKIEAFDSELVMIDQLLAAKKSASQAAYDDQIEAINKQMAAEEAKYAKLKAAAEEFYSANQNRLKEDDVYRAQLVADGEAREVAKLEKQKQLLIEEVQKRREKGASEIEIADETTRITNAFNKLIADTHKEYQDAMGDKNKEIGLANQEVKAKEAEGIDKIENELQGRLDGFRNTMYDAQLKLQQAFVTMAQSAAQAQIRIESQKFEVMRQMALAELEMAAKKALGKGDANGHRTALEQMQVIKNTPNPFQDMPGAPHILGPEIPRNTTQSSKTYDSPSRTISSSRDNTEGNPGREEVTNPRTRFHGDTWVGLGNNPDGIDTIPLNLHKGERIVPSYLNQFLGKDVTNQEFVHGYLQYANFQDRLPDISIPNIPSLQIPDIVSSRANNDMMLDIKKELRDLNTTFANKSLINVNIDGNNVSISEQRHKQKINYYDTLLKR